MSEHRKKIRTGLCKCGCGTTFATKHSGQVYASGCGRKIGLENAAANRRAETQANHDTKKAIQDMVRNSTREFTPMHLQQLTGKQLEAAVRKLIR